MWNDMNKFRRWLHAPDSWNSTKGQQKKNKKEMSYKPSKHQRKLIQTLLFAAEIGLQTDLIWDWWWYTTCGRKVMRLIFYLPKFLFYSNINVIPFKIVLLGSYTPMETLFPLLVAALGVFNPHVFSMSVTLVTKLFIKTFLKGSEKR